MHLLVWLDFLHAVKAVNHGVLKNECCQENMKEMYRRFLTAYRKIRIDKRYGPYADMLNFAVLIILIHYLYVFFTDEFDFVIHRVFGVYDWFNNTVFHQSKLVLGLIVPVKTNGHSIIFDNKDYINILFPCTGIQPMLQFAMLIFLYPGPFRHKFWFIPMGMVIIHFTNVFRIIGLGVVMAYWPRYWHYAHDYPFRIILYVVVFILWLVWNDKFYRPRMLRTAVVLQEAKDECPG